MYRMSNGNGNGYTARQAVVGRVLRASTTGFDCGTRGSRIDDRCAFGAFVKVPLGDDDRLCAVGLIYDVRIDDDPLARELVMASGVDPSTLMDQRENRMVPVEVCAVCVGHCRDGQMYHSLPPRPPLSLCEVELMGEGEVYDFTRTCGYFRLVLGAREVQGEELLGAALRNAAYIYPTEEARFQFLVGCGQQLVGILSHDFRRLNRIIDLINPN